MSDQTEIPFRQIPGLLWPCPVDHVHYMAPLSNISLMCVLGILSYSARNKPDRAVHLDAFGVQDISDPVVQQRRERRKDPLNGRSIHAYVPMYFATHTPMQYVRTIRPGGLSQDELVFIELDLSKLLVSEREVVIYTGNAASDRSEAYMGQVGIQHIKWEYVLGPGGADWATKIWKCAELLYPHSVNPEFFTRIVVYSERIRDHLRSVLMSIADNPKIQNRRRLRSLAERIVVDRTHYYST